MLRVLLTLLLSLMFAVFGCGRTGEKVAQEESKSTSSYDDTKRGFNGASWATQFPGPIIQRVSEMELPAGEGTVVAARFQPVGSLPGDQAFAIYRFPLDGYVPPSAPNEVLTCKWEFGNNPSPNSSMIVGFSLYEDGDTFTWDYHQVSNTGTLIFDDPYGDPNPLAHYRSELGNMYVVIFLSGQQDCRLKWIRMGQNIAPVVLWEKEYPDTIAPVTVGFLPEHSYDVDGYLTNYQAKWNSTLPNPANPPYDYESTTGHDFQHEYIAAGIYYPLLNLADDENKTAYLRESLTITANQLPQITLTATPSIGTAPLSVQLDASSSFDPDGSIVRFDWDWEGDGVYDLTNTASVQQRMFYAGMRTPTVKVIDNKGGSTTKSVQVNVTGGSWHYTDIVSKPSETGNGDSYYHLSLALIGSKPAVVYGEKVPTGPPYKLRYVQSNDEHGQSWGQPVTIMESYDYFVDETDLVELADGHPAVLYLHFGDRPTFARSNDLSGQSWPVPQSIDDDRSDRNSPDDAHLLIIEGKPVAFYGYGSTYPYSGVGIKYANDVAGSSWQDRQEVVGEPYDNGGGDEFSIGIINGNPAILYSGLTDWLDPLWWKYGPCLVRSSTPYGDWQFPQRLSTGSGITDGNGHVMDTQSFIMVAGKPAGCFERKLDTPSNAVQLLYTRALTGDGSAWPTDPTNILEDTPVGWPCMVEVGGRPTVCVGMAAGGGPLTIRKSSDFIGGTWSSSDTVDDDPGDKWCRMIEIEDNPAIVYQTEGNPFLAESDYLRFAIYY